MSLSVSFVSTVIDPFNRKCGMIEGQLAKPFDHVINVELSITKQRLIWSEFYRNA